MMSNSKARAWLGTRYLGASDQMKIYTKSCFGKVVILSKMGLG